MIKIYIPDGSKKTIGWDRQTSFLVDWEPPGVAWKYVHDMQEADWIICVMRGRSLEKQVAQIQSNMIPNQYVVFLNVFGSGEELGQVFESRDWMKNIDFFQQYRDRICFVDCNYCVKNQYLDVVYYDLLWERQKVYFTEYEKYDLSRRLYTAFSTSKMFALEDIVKTPFAKHYLAPMRTYPGENQRSRYRQLLRLTLDPDKGHMSNHEKGVFIEPQELGQHNLENPRRNFGGGQWLPAHNRYYQDSFVSVYVETITFGHSYKVITEKTYDPLIKGNFILPMGYQGMVQDIQDRGFLLPDWLDYSYDALPDSSRFDAYLCSVRSLLDMSQSKLFELYCRDKHILEHNRSLFFSSPRVSLLSLIQDNFRNRVHQNQLDPSSNG